MAERHRTQIERMIDEMIAAGKTEEEIRTAICKQYEPYDTLPQFREGFEDYQATSIEWRTKNYDGVAGQSYDRGANAAMWMWQARQRMKPVAQ